MYVSVCVSVPMCVQTSPCFVRVFVCCAFVCSECGFGICKCVRPCVCLIYVVVVCLFCSVLFCNSVSVPVGVCMCYLSVCTRVCVVVVLCVYIVMICL